MKPLKIGDVTITSLVERDGPWRTPQAMFPDWDPDIGLAHLASLAPEVYDPAAGKLVITYQTFLVRTPRHNILVDTCLGENKGFPPPLDFSTQPWLDAFRATGLRFEDIDYVFCTHLHFDHCGWNTRLVDGRWVPTFPKARYVFHRREYEAEAASASESWRMSSLPIVEAGQALLVDDDFTLDDTVWLTPTPGHSTCHCCVNIASRGQRAVVSGDMMHHALQCREPDWSTIFCLDPKQAAASRRRFLASVADTPTILLPTHFPSPTAGRIRADGSRFAWDYLRD